jgi:hypothetical protein
MLAAAGRCPGKFLMRRTAVILLTQVREVRFLERDQE